MIGRNKEWKRERNKETNKQRKEQTNKETIKQKIKEPKKEKNESMERGLLEKNLLTMLFTHNNGMI